LKQQQHNNSIKATLRTTITKVRIMTTVHSFNENASTGISIIAYLANKRKRSTTEIGQCRTCNQEVQWRLSKLVLHKINTCTVTELEKQQWIAKKQQDSNKIQNVIVNNHYQQLPNLSVCVATTSDSVSDIGNVSSISPKEATTTIVGKSYSGKQRTMTSFVDSMLPEQQAALEKDVANMFYRTAIPFNVADSDEFKAMFKRARPSFIPPSSKKIAGSLLNARYNELRKNTERIISEASNVIISSDGWSNIRGDHIVNYVVIIPSYEKPIFYKATDSKEVRQNGATIARELMAVIEELGGENKVSAVLTDNASVMQVAWDIIEQTYPTIFCNGCAAHVLNLLIQDICAVEEFEDIIEKAIDISVFIKRRTRMTQHFKALQATTNFHQFVSLPVRTRWYTQYQCCHRLLRNRQVLEQLAASSDLMDSFDGEKKVAFKANIQDPNFWVVLANLDAILELPSQLIGVAERDSSTGAHIYGYFQSLLSAPVYQDKNNILQLIRQRWDFVHTSSMGFAVLLDPKGRAGAAMIENDQSHAIAEIQTHLCNHKEKYNITSTNFDLKAEVMSFLALASSPDISMQPCLQQDSTLTAMQWWLIFGQTRFPNLFKLAQRVLVIPTSSASSERVWSVFSLIHSKQRNRLSNESVIKLSYTYINASLGHGNNVVSTVLNNQIDYCQQQLNLRGFPNLFDDDEVSINI
jgi:ABC-type dipeptide/oligopeptide/nickel transport system ATPase component